MVANSEVDARDFLDDSVDVIFNDTVLSEIGAFGYFLKVRLSSTARIH